MRSITSVSPMVFIFLTGCTPAPPTGHQSSLRLILDFSQPDWEQQANARPNRTWGFKAYPNKNIPLNARVMPPQEDTPHQEHFLRIAFPAGSASPSYSRKSNPPIIRGGAQRYFPLPPADKLTLDYYFRFSPYFDFVKGGKLPGLAGGEKHSGGTTGDFSTRYMWRGDGQLEVYAYLADGGKQSFRLGKQVTPNRWHRISQQVVLNTPGASDGQLLVWFNDHDQPVLDQSGLLFRRQAQPQIEWLYLSTFFGGQDKSWSTPKDQYIDFAQFQVH